MFHPFQVERYLSEREQSAEFHLAESGVHPMTLAELLDVSNLSSEILGGVLLDYPEVNGSASLREHIAAMYPDADADNVLVTVGASEANQIVASTLLDVGDEIVVFSPTYMQLPGNALNLGATVKTVPLVERNGWAIDLNRLDAAVSDRTKAIAVVNPNNPTGHVLTPVEVNAIVAAAERSGAWIVADEVYCGTERNTESPTPSFWGATDRVIAINSMSKAYGLPGLRLGWVVAPSQIIDNLWRRHEYATISTSTISMSLAEACLAPPVRAQLTARARGLIRRGFDTLTEALALHPGVFSVVAPDASAMSFVSYDLPLGSEAFAEELLADHGVLVIPGDCFGSPRHFRLSSALPEDYLKEALTRLNTAAERHLD